MNEIEKFRNEKGQFTKGNRFGSLPKKPRFKERFREAMQYVASTYAEKHNTTITPEEIELLIMIEAIEAALKGKYAFYKDIMDRIYGKARTDEEPYET